MAIFRGAGGSGDATTDATNQASVASDAAVAAANSATNAANSATNAATSATNASTSASNASTSASNAATSETNAATSETNAATSASAAAITYDNFDDRYLGSKSTAPSVDNDGNALLTGALYWNSTSNTMNVWTGSAWTGLGGSSGVSSFNTRTGAVTLSSSDVTTALTYTPLNPANNLSEVTASTARTNLSVPSTTGSGATGTWNIDVLGNASTVTNGVYTTGNQTIGGTKTFSSTISGSINGNAATVTNGVVTTGSYSDPTWLTISKSKVGLGNVENTALSTWAGSSNITTVGTLGTLTVTATITGSVSGNAGTVTNGVYTTSSYANPSWITSLAETKVLPSQTGNSGKYLTTNGTSTSWATVTGGSMVYPGAGIAVSTGSAWATSLTDNSANWNTAFTERLRWDGGSTGLTASTGRTSLGATTVGSNLFTLTNPSAITFPRFNADNTVSSLSASDFRTAIGAGTSSTTGTVTSVAALTLGTTGTDLSSSVANGTTTPVITLNVPTASATNRGALSSADWTTFNNKGNGTVTSVGLSAPSIFTVTNSPVTSSGTLTLSYSGTALPIANGGTGQTTAAAAYNALNPMTTVGDIIYEGTGPAAARLPIGTNGQVLTVVSGLPAWAAATGGGASALDDLTDVVLTSPTTGQVLKYNGTNWINDTDSTGSGSFTYPSAGIPNSTGSAWGTSYTTSGTGTVVALATSPTLTTATTSGKFTFGGAIDETVYPITSSTTPALSPANGTIQTWTLTGTSTPTAGTWDAGESMTLMVNDTASTFTVNWSSVSVTWVGGSAPTLTPASGFTVIELWKVGTTIYGALVGQVA